MWRPLDGRWVDSGFAAWPVPSEGQGRIAFGIYWSDNKPKKEGLAMVIIEDIQIQRL